MRLVGRDFPESSGELVGVVSGLLVGAVFGLPLGFGYLGSGGVSAWRMS